MNLASAEMKNLFDWTRVTREVRVITPDFYTYKGGRLSTVVVYAKMCRGEMTRFILKNRIENPEDLKTFEWEGYRFNPRESHDDHCGLHARDITTCPHLPAKPAPPLTRP